MGRAAPDLPDPLENAESAPTGGADDLLSQLAGDEIDRLLAEADVESAPLPETAEVSTAAAATDTAEPAPVAADASASTAPALESQLDELFSSLNEPPPAAPTEVAAEAAVTPPRPVATPAPAATDLDDQLAKLANELLPTPEPVEELTPVDAPAVAEAVTPQDLPQEISGEDERAALLAEPASDAPPEELYEEAGDGAVPWYLWPLVWLNAPFAAISDGARDRIGKVALATLLFSITVLTFLAVTRHHP